MEGSLNPGMVKVVIHQPIKGDDADILCTEAKNVIADELSRQGWGYMQEILLVLTSQLPSFDAVWGYVDCEKYYFVCKCLNFLLLFAYLLYL